MSSRHSLGQVILVRIHELEITDVRGVRHVLLNFDGKNAVIWGPNGSGKSAIVDAIDFLLKGSISRLEGDGAGCLSTARHGPHIDASLANATVRATVTIPGHPEAIEISRKMNTPIVLQCSDESALPVLEPVLDVARLGQYVLARREILRFITATGGNRAKWIQSLMRLDSLESMRSVLVSAAGDAKKQALAATRTVDDERSTFASTAKTGPWTEEGALEAINAARAVLDAVPIAELTADGIKSGITPQSITKVDQSASRLIQALAQVRQFLESTLVDTRQTAQTVEEAALTLCGDATSLALLRRHNLIHVGLDLIEEDGACPLCGTPWEPGELQARLNEELRLSGDVATKRQALDALIAALLPQLGRIRQAITNAQEAAVALGLAAQDEEFANQATVLSAYEMSVAAQSDELSPMSAAALKPPGLLDGVAMEAELLRLEAAAAALIPAMTPEQEAWDLLTRLHDALERIRTAEQKAQAAGLLRERAETLKSTYCSARDEVLNGLYEAIKTRFVQLYGDLHAEDGEDSFDALLEHDGAALGFRVDFFGRGLHPPHALHSEGHQDSMGICLYLALSEHIDAGIVGILVLDDVVMSVDSGHRRRLCGVLKDHFPNTQFIITTHDRGWAHQLKTEGVVPAKGMTQFCGWTVETGPRVTESDVWDRIDACLAADDVRGAAGYLRGAMEEFFANACESLQARVVYRGSGQYTLGDYLPSAAGRYSELVKLAKAAASSWSRQDEADRLGEIHSVQRQCLSRTQAEQWATNKALHYDAWYSLEAADLRAVVDAFRDLCASFQCSDCGTMLTLSMTGYDADSVRCACKRIDWNLVKKKAQ